MSNLDVVTLPIQFIVIDIHHLHYRSIVPLGMMYTFYLLRFVMPSASQSWGRITCVGICAVIMQGSVHDDSTELHVMYPRRPPCTVLQGIPMVVIHLVVSLGETHQPPWQKKIINGG